MRESILNTTKHRPYPLPKGFWIAEQVWHNLLLAHWPVEKELLASFIPAPLQLDTRDGRGWITISPFKIIGNRLRFLPLIPFIHSFLELNVRTYVIYNGVPGIYFFSIDASNFLAVTAAKLLHLPYQNASITASEHMQQQGLDFHSHRKAIDTLPLSPQIAFQASYNPISNQIFHADAGTELYWLTERYRMYTTNKQGKVLAVDIHHLPWPLQKATVDIQQNTLLQPFNISLSVTPHLVTYTERLHSLIWPIRVV